MFSDRTNWSLTENTLTQTLKALKDKKTDVIDLTVSNPTQCGFRYPQEIISALANSKSLVYEPSARGLSAARQRVCQYYQEQGFIISPEQVFLTASTSEAYSYLFRLLTNPGDKVLFPKPSYPLFSFLADLNDVELDFYSLRYKDGWKIDIEDLKSLVNSKTKAVVVVNPNNPTGSFIQSEEQALINQICRRELAIISDEVFWDFAWDNKLKPVSFVKNDKTLAFTMGGLSKTLGLPQMKLSWIIVSGPQDLVEAASNRLEVIADTYLSINTPTQHALSDWMPLRQDIQSQIKKRLFENLECLKKNLGVESQLLQGEGGWYAVVRLSDSIREEALILELLQKDHILVHPGYFFDFEEEPFLVLSLLPPASTFEKGVKGIVKRIQSLR